MKKKTLKILLFTILVTASISCVDEMEDESKNQFSLIGNVKLYDNLENEIYDYSDIGIKLIDKNNRSLNIETDSEGSFKVEHIDVGDVSISISKNGYIGIDISGFNNTSNSDTIPEIILVEEMPFSFHEFEFSYDDGWITWNKSTEYSTEDNYLVGECFCLDTQPNVTINSNKMVIVSGASIDVQQIKVNAGNNASINYNRDAILSYGFEEGDKIYVVDYAISNGFASARYQLENSFDNVTFEMNNLSPITSFILK